MTDAQTMSNEGKAREKYRASNGKEYLVINGQKYWAMDENGEPMYYDEDASSDDMIAELLAWTMERKAAKQSQLPPTE